MKFNKLKIDNFKDFPFTVQMMEKNDYTNYDTITTKDENGINGICIYEKNSSYIYISSLEVRKDCQGLGIGTNILNELKKNKKEIYLQSLDNARKFYERNKFVELADNVYQWKI